MGNPSYVVKDGIGGHFDCTLAIGPSKVLNRIMIKDIRNKDAFLTIADRAGNPAVVAIYTLGKISVQFLQAVCGLGGLGKYFIAIGGSFMDQRFNGPRTFWWFLRVGKIKVIIKRLTFRRAGLDQKLIVGIDSEKSD